MARQSASGEADEAVFSSLVAGLADRDRRAIALALSHFEAMTPTAARLRTSFGSKLGCARVVGITGPPGAGKSTLVNALVRPFRDRGIFLGIIAVDPSSPFSGGAILGDRLRMTAATADAGVFVRSLAAQGSLGGLTPAAVRTLDGFDSAGFDMVIIETVGTGQSEIDIAQIADVSVVVGAPGLGDHVQAMKAGLLEIADVIVVNKADQPGAEATRQQLAGAISVRSNQSERTTPVLVTIATSEEGITPLADTIEAMLHKRSGKTPAERRRSRARYLVMRAAADLVAERARSLEPPLFDKLADDLLSGQISIEEAACALISGPRGVL